MTRVQLKNGLILWGIIFFTILFLFYLNLVPTSFESLGFLSVQIGNGSTRITKDKVKEPLTSRLWWLLGSKSSNNQYLWPEEAPGEVRFVRQLQYRPEGFENAPVKQILAYDGLEKWEIPAGPSPFVGCPVDRCTVTVKKSDSKNVDAILFKDTSVIPEQSKPHRQVWILRMMENPLNTKPIKKKFSHVFNWTATYRLDSDLIYSYGKWVYYDENYKQFPRPIRNFALNKNKKVAWFVSNCNAKNNRLEYAHELQKYIDVDIYGDCGTMSCPRSSEKECFDLLEKDYKFYLAFENANCIHYITEKFFYNGLGHNILPIAMGARKEDYLKTSPEHSFIYVDDFSGPKELATYLHKLDQDDNLYNEYFRWKGTGELLQNYFFCRLCALLHDNYPDKWYPDINEWWRGKGTCKTVS